jgi:hypothetical protein
MKPTNMSRDNVTKLTRAKFQDCVLQGGGEIVWTKISKSVHLQTEGYFG